MPGPVKKPQTAGSKRPPFKARLKNSKAGIIARGWTQPSKNQLRQFSRKLLEKIDKEAAPEIRKIPESELSERIQDLLEKKSAPLEMRMATKYALDSIGVKYQGEQGKLRKSIHELTKRTIELSDESRRKPKLKSEIHAEIAKLAKEIRERLGPVKSTVFFLRLHAILFKLTKVN